MFDRKYRKLKKHGAYQTAYKKYVPTLEEQVRRIEQLQRTAGNIPYKQLICVRIGSDNINPVFVPELFEQLSNCAQFNIPGK